MRIGIGAPRGTDTGASGMISLLTADPWLTYRLDGRVSDRIASGWAWDAEGTTLRLTLRKDVYFHDGTLITPEVAAQVLRSSAGSARSTAGFKSIQDIRAEGPDRVAIRLKERNDFLVSELAGTLVVKPDNVDVGTGPFQIVKRAGRDATLSAFPRYYRGTPALAGIDVKNYPTQRNAWAALMRGEIDMLYEVGRDAAEFVKETRTVNTYTFPRPYYIPLVFNVRRAVFKDPRVRQAINLAVDQATVVRDGMAGRGSVADGPIWPQHWRTPRLPRHSPSTQPPLARSSTPPDIRRARRRAARSRSGSRSNACCSATIPGSSGSPSSSRRNWRTSASTCA